MNTSFEETLARGTAGEDLVYTWLKQSHAYVQDMRYQTHAKGTGPRLDGLAGSVIMPDFVVYDRYKGKNAIDVKTKSAVYPVNGKLCFTVDDYKFRDYMQCVGLMNLDKLLFLFVYQGDFYIYESSEHIGLYRFGNAYGKQAYLFEYNTAKIRR